MTYCLAIKLSEGLVFCSDSRTNAGADRVSTYSKMHSFDTPGDRQIILLSAGNLGTTQSVVHQIHRDVEDGAEFNIHNATYISDIADYLGEISLGVQKKYAPGGPESGFNAEATFILGGQIKGKEPELYMIYPEGNHITTSKRYPFIQIGETKYGKPILERLIRSDTTCQTALLSALVSMDSTVRSNATVGPPIELMFYPNDTLGQAPQYHCFELNDPYLLRLRQSWDINIRKAFNDLPGLDELFPAL